MKERLLVAAAAFICLSNCSPSEISQAPGAGPLDPIQERIQRVENGLILVTPEGEIEAGNPKTLTERMEHYGVPGISIAVIQDYEIEWAKGYGVLETGGDRLVTPESLFNAGSIFKPVAAASALVLVEEGILDLDENLNRKLVSWQIPDNEYTAEEKVTLRRLLSHSAGLTDGFTSRSSSDPEPDYVRSAGVPLEVTIQQMLDAEPGVDVDGPTRVTVVPGAEWHYANADYALLLLLLEDVTGRPFAGFMQETVLDPLEMTSSTFAQPLPESLRIRATTEHYESGQPFPGKRHHYPFGGLWTTPSDLSRFGIELMQAYKGRSGKFLSREMASEMLSSQIETPNELLGDSFGLGIQLRGAGPDFQIVHTGGTWGSTCLLWVYPETGQGTVIMTNSAGEQGLIRFEILLGIASEYGWPLTQ